MAWSRAGFVGWLGRTTGTTCATLLAGRIDQTKQNDPIYVIML